MRGLLFFRSKVTWRGVTLSDFEFSPLCATEVRFLPLGGLGEIGMNCFALEQAGEILVVDCGASFPDDDLGADLIVPDFAWLASNRQKIVGLVITHGHEDHIGAIPQFLRSVGKDVPIYAPAHAAALIAARLEQRGHNSECLLLIEPGEQYPIGSFVVEPIRVAHSIVGATALGIQTCAGLIIHTADFNLDAEQPAGYLTDEARFRQLGEQGVRLLLSDSTNILSHARPQSEGDVGRFLVQAVSAAKQRVVVSLFSSNAHRVHCLFDAAVQTGRKICLLGRSLERQVEIATRLGYLNPPSHLFVSKEQAEKLPRDEILVLAGGSQAEPTSALRRLSQGTHPHLSLQPHDQVLLSARIIPGNEKAVFVMVNDLIRSGVEVIHRQSSPAIHTSGHASRPELRRMLEWVRPESFIPVHGTLVHLRSHAALAGECGVGDVQVVENGQAVCFSRATRLARDGRLPVRCVRVAMGGEILGPETRRRRGDLGRSGLLVVSVVVDARGELRAQPTVTSLGVPAVDGDEGAASVLINTVRRILQTKGAYRMRSTESYLRSELRSVVQKMCGVRPVVQVHVCRVEPFE